MLKIFFISLQAVIILTRSLERSEGFISNPIKYIHKPSRFRNGRLCVRYYVH